AVHAARRAAAAHRADRDGADLGGGADREPVAGARGRPEEEVPFARGGAGGGGGVKVRFMLRLAPHGGLGFGAGDSDAQPQPNKAKADVRAVWPHEVDTHGKTVDEAKRKMPQRVVELVREFMKEQGTPLEAWQPDEEYISKLFSGPGREGKLP